MSAATLCKLKVLASLTLALSGLNSDDIRHVEAFPCDVSKPEKLAPTSAADVHPGHIKYVLAVGDSITAGFGADRILGVGRGLNRTVQSLHHGGGLDGHSNDSSVAVKELPVEWRQVSFSGGEGTADNPTLPYYLKKYSPSLSGGSVGKCLPQTPEMNTYGCAGNNLNLALSNAHSWQLDIEFSEFVNQTSKIPDFAEQWKLLTIFIGANDLCDGIWTPDGYTGHEACDGHAAHSALLLDRYESKLRSLMTSLKDSMKNVIIQIVSMFDLSTVYTSRRSSWYCTARAAIVNECNCLDRSLQGLAFEQQLIYLKQSVTDINNRIAKVVTDFNMVRPDFAVIAVVATESQDIPLRFLSGLDCFHPSATAHGAIAKLLWNSLFDTKRVPASLDSDAPLACPTSRSVIYVPQHSNTSVVV